MAADVTDETFQTAVIDRSAEVTVVIDLWAPWCGPCRTLGPVLEKVVDEAGDALELVKVNIDDNPQVAAAFRVQSIPAVFAVRDKAVVDGFIGALPEAQVREWVDKLAPQASEADQLVALGDEASLRQALALEPDHAGAIVGLAELLVGKGDDASKDEALAVLARIPESPETRRVAAQARTGVTPDEDDFDDKLVELLPRVKADEAARQEYVDLLEVMGSEDPRTADYRRKLSAALF
ncbi:MAG TPA: tetratricopeptide repeat protein [Acidimicrobiia bacterium]|nr:tetratricopeptide repeat protein [Acidimicrobiia bacterium]